MIAGSISASLFNAHGGKKGGEPCSFQDFHPDHALDPEGEEMDPEEAHKLAQDQFALALNMVPV